MVKILNILVKFIYWYKKVNIKAGDVFFNGHKLIVVERLGDFLYCMDNRIYTINDAKRLSICNKQERMLSYNRGAYKGYYIGDIKPYSRIALFLESIIHTYTERSYKEYKYVFKDFAPSYPCKDTTQYCRDARPSVYAKNKEGKNEK